jgi:hypothetical protein
MAVNFTHYTGLLNYVRKGRYCPPDKFFFNPFYLQAVEIDLANGVKLREA